MRDEFLIQNQVPKKVIYNGVTYKSLKQFATKNRFYTKTRYHNLAEFLKRNYNCINNTYDLDSSHYKPKIILFLKEKTTKNGIGILYKKQIYPSILSFAKMHDVNIRYIRNYIKNNNLKPENNIIHIPIDFEKILKNHRKQLLLGHNIPKRAYRFNNKYWSSETEFCRYFGIERRTFSRYIIRNFGYSPEWNLSDPKNKKMLEYIRKFDKNYILYTDEEKAYILANGDDSRATSCLYYLQDHPNKNFVDIIKYYNNINKWFY